MPEWAYILLGGFIAATPALLTAVFNFYKNKADVAKTYHDMLDAGAKENAKLRESNRIYRRGAESLIRQLERNNLEPCWQPPEDNNDS